MLDHPISLFINGASSDKIALSLTAKVDLKACFALPTNIVRAAARPQRKSLVFQISDCTIPLHLADPLLDLMVAFASLSSLTFCQLNHPLTPWIDWIQLKVLIISANARLS
jgi:hypothetical protein